MNRKKPIALRMLLFLFFLIKDAGSVPIFLASSLAWYLHPGWGPLVCVGLCILLWNSVKDMARNRIANTHQVEAVEEFLVGEKFDIEITDFPEELKKEASDIRKFKTRFFSQGIMSRFGYWQHEPLVVLLAKAKGGRLLGQAKAFLNPFGTSVLVVDRPADRMDEYARFILYHEFGHITKEGERQLSEAHFGRLWRPLTLLLFVLWVQVWWQWLIVLAYLVYIYWGRNFSFGVNEALADNLALRRFSDLQTQLRIVNDLTELLEAGAARGTPKRQLMAFGRLLFIKRTQASLQKGQPLTRLTELHGNPWLFDAMFAALFLTWPMVSPQVPLSSIVAMVTYLLIGEVNRFRSIAIWKQGDKVLQQHLARLSRASTIPSSSSASSP